MRRAMTLLLILSGCFALYGYKGFLDGRADAPALIARADALIATGRGGADLGDGRAEILLTVEDPNFINHNGIDLQSAGGGITTVTQSLAKRTAFDHFRPGLPKLRQSTYAIALERHLSKDQIFALWLDTLEMGRGPDGWMTGFFDASIAVFGQPPAALSDADFLKLVAVPLAPGMYRLTEPDPRLEDRVARITRLLAGDCQPDGNSDVWLEACS